jgi:hypothetical protein
MSKIKRLSMVLLIVSMLVVSFGSLSFAYSDITLGFTAISENTVSLSWSDANVAYYDIYKNDVLLCPYVSAYSTNIQDLSSDTVYEFEAVGKDSDDNVVCTSNRLYIKTLPTTLTLSSSSKTQTSVSLSWNYNAYAPSYDIYKDGSYYTTVTYESCTITGLSAGTTYGFDVRAKTSSGSVFVTSNTLNVTTDQQPQQLTVTSPSKTSTAIWLTWNNIAAYYEVYRNGNMLCPYVSAYSLCSSGLTPNTTYSFMVKGRNGQGQLIYTSNTIYVTTLP